MCAREYKEVAGTCDYGLEFCVALARDNVFAVHVSRQKKATKTAFSFTEFPSLEWQSITVTYSNPNEDLLRSIRVPLWLKQNVLFLVLTVDNGRSGQGVQIP